MMSRKRGRGRLIAAALAAAALWSPARAVAEVTLPAIFGSGMVLQSGMPVRVWGRAAPGGEVSVSIAGQEKAATAGADGRWEVLLDPLTPGGPHSMTVKGENTVVFEDVLAGEVWLGSGQSNMYWPVRLSGEGEAETARAHWPEIRLFTVEQALSDTPLTDCSGAWVACGPETVGDFAATAYYFGRKLHRELGVPVGLIHSSWRGTYAETWISDEALLALPDIHEAAVNNWAQYVERYPERQREAEAAMEVYQAARAAWREEARQALAEGRPRPELPRAPRTWRAPSEMPNAPSRLFNAMIAPLVPYTIRGVIWYQGEANTPRGFHYRRLFPALITDWRDRWGQGEFPFIFAQISWWYVTAPGQEPLSGSGHAELRESQSWTARNVPLTAMAVTYDLGGERQVHFADKQEVGRRMALAALALAHGREELVHSGPVYESMSIEDGRVRLEFSHAGSGLELRAPRGGETAGSFAVAGPDRRFRWAEAEIEGDALVVFSPEVPEPVAVRYLWNENAPCILYNLEGLPASPFRTDDWPGRTDHRVSAFFQ